MEAMRELLPRYLERMGVRGLSARTIANHRGIVGLFLDWCEARGLAAPDAVTKPILDRYQRHLFHLRQPGSGRPLSFRTQHVRLVPVKRFFQWLVRDNYLPSNPASDLEMPKRERRLPKAVLSADEAEAVLAVPDVEEPLGLRDRALLEVLYATGLRRSEVRALSVFDVDRGRGTLTVRSGKGGRDRVVPLGERAQWWVDRYVDGARPLLLSAAETESLFLTSLGEPMSRAWLSQHVKDLVTKADIGKSGSCHLFRHTMATLMLENGADIRHVQEMLGHVQLATTEIYTHVSVRHLQEVHARTHPGAKLRRSSL